MSLKYKISCVILGIILTTLLAIVGVFAALDLDFKVSGDITYTAPIVAEDETAYPNLIFEVLNENEKTATVIGDKNEQAEEIIIPSHVTIGGTTYKVTEFGDGYISHFDPMTLGAFVDFKSIKHITIPDTITEIGDYEFFGSSIQTIDIGSGVTSIGKEAFRTSSLQSINIPDNVLSIGDSAFRACNSLSSVTIGKGITTWGDEIFRGCTNLSSAIINSSFIRSSAFSDCSGLTSVTIGNNVTSIGDFAFSGRSGLTSVTIPNSVTSIGSYAFNGCTGLTSITIPASVTSIGEDAFKGCTGLTSIVVESGNGVYDSRNNCNAIIETASNKLIAGFDITIIPASVTSIGDGAFSGCSSRLKSITIPASVTSIGSWAFYGCDSLTTVNYAGSEADWANITIGTNNEDLTSATINYNS